LTGLNEYGFPRPADDVGRDARDRNLAQETRDWTRETTGWFLKKQYENELQLYTKQDRDAAYAEVLRLLKKNELIAHHADHGKYRKRYAEIEEIRWQEAAGVDLPIKWPFHIEEYVKFFPKNSAVIASHPDGGKSGFVFDFVRRNLLAIDDLRQHFADPFTIHVFDSEKGKEELSERIKRIDDVDIGAWGKHVKFWERSSRFEDVIHPDAINVIDYLEIVENFAEVGKDIKAIHDNLDTGIALIALQKNWGASLGRGGVGSIEKPRLYMTMDRGRLKIEKAKNWRSIEHNPNGMIADFKLVGGSNFHITRQLGPEYYEEKRGGRW